MADIELDRLHALGLAAAREAAERMAADLGQRFGLQGEWQGDVLRFERPGVSGRLEVSEGNVRLVVSLGVMLAAMRGSIEQAVAAELDRHFPDSDRCP